MPLLTTIDGLMLQGFAILLVWAAVTDFWTFKIPNRVSLSVALLYPAYVLADPQPVEWIPAAGIALGPSATGAFAFSRGWLGGGDVKLFAASVLWAGPELLPEFLVVTTIAGGLLGATALSRPWFAMLLPTLIAPAAGEG